MRNVDPHISLLLNELSVLLDKNVELTQSDFASDSCVVAAASSGVPLAIRADGALFDAAERRVVQQLVDLIQRDSLLRADHAALDQRLRLVERENLDLSMKNRALADISSRDSLTGLFTRWYVLDKIEAEMNRALRHGSPMSLLMIDVDHFKQINDSFGHQTGDIVLQHLGQLLRDSCRVYDVPGRYGGEEFCLMLPETRLDNTLAVAERIRKRVESTPMGGSEATIRVTASIGIAALDNIPDEALMGAASLIERADRALYSAKDNGRNRIEFWSAAQAQLPHRAFEH